MPFTGQASGKSGSFVRKDYPMVDSRTAGAVLSLATVLAVCCCCSAPRRQKVRIASNDSPTFNFLDEQRRPTGFAIEVMNQAAAHAGMELEWVASDMGPGPTFAAGKADLWPVVTYFEARKQVMHLTEPWWRLATVMYFREELQLKSVADLANRRLAYTSPSKLYLPTAGIPKSTTVDIVASPYEGMVRLCKGEADAAWIDLQLAGGVLLNRPPECANIRFGAVTVEEGIRAFSIGARFGFEKEAERLRAGIDQVAESGEIVRIANRWNFVDQTDLALFTWLDGTRRKAAMWRTSVMVLFSVLGVSIIALFLVQRARTRAELSAKARAEFLANMSHELRTPMNAILGMTDLALHTNLDAEQREYLTHAHNSGTLLLSILNDILDFSRIESGRLPIEQIPFELREIVRRSVVLLSLQAQAKGLVLREEIDPAIPRWLQGDPSRIQQVLVNLLGNATKFSNQGEIVLRAECLRLEGARCHLAISVQDQGIGIPTDQQQRIFAPFTQADASTTRRYGGTGLGLAICSKLVRMMGGHISVQSRPGVGSTFRIEITLPAADAQPEAEAAPPPSTSRPLRLLVAEDNLVNRTLIERMMAKEGHLIRSVENGQRAIELLASEKFDAVLMDIHMPEMDGLEAARRIRARESVSGGHVPIVALTALAVHGDQARCIEAGMDAYLSKPFKREDLIAVLVRFEKEGLIAS
jgi:signal transduction histidine kinase/ActR/RegA family two-component response regulator